MKTAILLMALILFVTASCENKQDEHIEIVKLQKQVSSLKAQNKKLQDSLDEVEEDFLHSQILIGIPDNEILTVGKKNRIAMLFQTFNKKLPQYEVFRIDGDKEVKIGNGDNTRFDFDYAPKSSKDNTLKMFVKMPNKDKIIKIPLEFWFRVKN